MNDFPNIGFYDQKYRFGTDAEYPTTRYTRGLTRSAVPDQAHETDPIASLHIGDQDANADCINALFAQGLPPDPSAELVT